MKILIVDDKEEERYLAETLLKGSGYQVVSATNGAEALEKLRTEGFDMIVSDVLMPVMDGFRLCRECKGDEKLKDIPFIFYTATYKDERDEELASKVGADRFIRKPIEPEEFVKIIQSVIRDVEEGKIGPKRRVLEEEREVLKLYSERLIEKLEKKMLDLEAEITEHRKAEDTLRESKEFSDSLITSMQDGFSVLDPNGVHIDVNTALCEITGFSREELIGVGPPHPYWPPEEYEKTEKAFEKTLKGEFGTFELTFMRKNGERFPVIVSPSWVKDEQGNVVSYFATVKDITERKRAEEEIRRAAEEWRTTFDSITDLVFIVDKNFSLLRVNKAFADVVKRKPKELIGKPCYQIVHGTNKPIPLCPHKETIKTKKPATVEFFEPYLRMHLEVYGAPIFDGKGEVVGSVHIVRDISERKKMQEQLIVTDRLASIGELSSGIAHELNNPLTAVIGFSDLLLGKDVPDDVKEDLKVVNREAKRTAAVVRNLLTFARGHPEEKQAVDINKGIQNVLGLRAYEQRVNNIEVNTQFAADLPEVLADGFQLQQVFLNIIINAEHFMSEAHGRGTLTITTERAGGIIRASFADNGPGISPGNLSHLFNPFFTTKEVGKGTGLGLSICYGIISEHGGKIYAESELGKGATFVVELPISKQ